jgi:hypothetical protein
VILKRILAGLALATALWGTHAMAVEEPPFKPVLKDGPFEVRDYPALTVAQVTVTGEQREAAGKGFRLLAGYIFGGNKTRKSIAMTAPVAQERASEKIAMTAPVTQERTAGAWIVRFTMPSGYTLQTLPEPNDPKVHLEVLSPSRVAVLRFSGVARSDAVAAKTAELDALAKAHNLRVAGPASLAQYDPPWTPWFMRRNEVMVPVER